jgi:hypothetical protein
VAGKTLIEVFFGEEEANRMREEETPPTAQTFVALYRGPTIGDACVVGVSINPDLAALVAETILSQSQDPAGKDPVLDALNSGRRTALRLIVAEARDAEEKQVTQDKRWPWEGPCSSSCPHRICAELRKSQDADQL